MGAFVNGKRRLSKSRAEGSSPSAPARIMFKPQTRLGKWSVGAAIFILLSFALSFSQDVGINDLEESTSRSALEVLFLILVALLSVGSVTAFFGGIISIIRDKERSILVFASTIIGLYLLPSFISLAALMLGIRH